MKAEQSIWHGLAGADGYVAWRWTRAAVCACLAIWLVGCASMRYEAPYTNGPVELQVRELPKSLGDGESLPMYVPTGTPSAMAVGAVVAALLPSKETMQRALDRFEVPARASVGNVDVAHLLRTALQGELRAIGLDVAVDSGPAPLQLKVTLAHGIVENESPVFVPKLVAKVQIAPPAPRVAYERKVVFFGFEHGFSSGALDKMAQWWTTNGRYRTFFEHATRAIAKQLVHSQHRDPAARDEQSWRRVQVALGAHRAEDLTSDACAFEPQAKVVYVARRRLHSVSLAAFCSPASPYLSGFKDTDLEWVLP